MSRRSLFLSLLGAACSCGLLGPAHASETLRLDGLRPLDTPISLVERYTNATQDVILEGLKLVGVRYKMGGNSSETGLDCSSFVQTVFKESIGTNQLKPGDLVFFNTMRRAFSHVGIYLGDNHFLHAPRAGAEIRVENMNSGYWLTRFNGGRRLIDAR